jgi:SAGA-associated factor 29
LCFVFVLLQYKQQKNKKGRKRGREGVAGGIRRDSHQEDRILDRGDKVAAKLNQDDPWILASIVKYSPQKDKYQVEDEDSGDEGDGVGRRHRRRHTVNAAHVVPLSKANSPDADNFQAGDRVMAVYPNTTSFYPCTVVFGPRQSGGGVQSKNTTRVVVKFDDDEDETGTIPEHRIPRRYVLPLPRI